MLISAFGKCRKIHVFVANNYIVIWQIFHCHRLLHGGPLPVINVVVTPISRLK